MKSIFIKNFATTTLLLAFSFLLLAISFIGIGRTYLIEDYRRGMIETTAEVAHTASAIARGNSLSDWTMSMVISSISGSTGNHIFITNEDGKIITCSDKRPYCEHIGRVVPSEVLEKLEFGTYDQLTTLDSVYPEKRYVAGRQIKAETDGKLLGFCFVSAEIGDMLGAWTTYLSWAIVAFAVISLLDHLYWIFGSVLGAWLGQQIPMDYLQGIDFSMTALFLVIVTNQTMESLINAKMHRCTYFEALYAHLWSGFISGVFHDRHAAAVIHSIQKRREKNI